MVSGASAVAGVTDRQLIGMLAQAILEDWPAETRLADVLASAGLKIETDLTVLELTAA